jgi:hypothetical protein
MANVNVFQATPEMIKEGVILKDKRSGNWWKCYSIITSNLGNKEFFFHFKGKTKSIKPKDFRKYTLIGKCSD